jgi:hypothetical protein
LSDKDWFVFLKGNEVHAQPRDNRSSRKKVPFEIVPLDSNEYYKMRGDRSVIKVDDGYLIAFWQGEFGGSLYWFDTRGKTRKLVANAKIVQFIKRDSKIYAMEGLAHMGMSYGSIVEIAKVNEEWAISEYLRLPFAPYTAQLDPNNNLIIVTSGNLLLIDKDGNVDTLTKGFWSDLYPNSMVRDKDVLYVGMRKGVFRFDLLNRKQQWLMPK